MVAQFTKTADTYAPYFSVWINTSNTLTGATQLATSGLSGSSRFGSLFRSFFINLLFHFFNFIF